MLAIRCCARFGAHFHFRHAAARDSRVHGASLAWTAGPRFHRWSSSRATGCTHAAVGLARSGTHAASTFAAAISGIVSLSFSPVFLFLSLSLFLFTQDVARSLSLSARALSLCLGFWVGCRVVRTVLSVGSAVTVS